MTEQEVTKLISNLLEHAKSLIEEALEIGRAHGIPVNLGQLGIGDDMWYVSEQEYLQDRLYDEGLEGDLVDGNITQEEYDERVKEITEEVREMAENDGYDDHGYKRMGWISSSTNC